MEDSFTFESNLWLYSGDGAWHFITMPQETADIIRTISGKRRGFGSIRVKATIGKTEFQTSIFPDSKSGSYVLPVKKSVRTTENIHAGDTIKVIFSFRDQL